ncbi:MAG: hypothetical protein AAF772_13095, partial [Acidobacteriota bacterium]
MPFALDRRSRRARRLADVPPAAAGPSAAVRAAAAAYDVLIRGRTRERRAISDRLLDPSWDVDRAWLRRLLRDALRGEFAVARADPARSASRAR